MTPPQGPDRDRLDAAAVCPLLRGTFGSPYLYAEQCPSTQDLLRGTTLPEGAVAVTEHQTAGRGRSDRVWEDAPTTALLMSVLLRPPGDAPLPQLSLVAGTATAAAVEAVAGGPVLVKWPNDVLLAGRKVAGVLLEAAGGAVVCGIGVNVNQREQELPRNPRAPAASLRTVTGREHDRAALLAGLLDALERRYRAWLQGGLEALAGELADRHGLRGRQARAGQDLGVVGEIAPDGRLELLVEGGGLRLVESGEVEPLD